jgi:hypothetical protein
MQRTKNWALPYNGRFLAFHKFLIMSKLEKKLFPKNFLPLHPMLARFIFSVGFFTLLHMAQAQVSSGTNPFEIKNRLAVAVPDSVIGNGRLANPFDVVAHRMPGVTQQLGEEATLTRRVADNLISFPKGDTIHKSFVFGVMLVFLIFFTLAVGANRSVLLKAWRSFLGSNAMNIAQREALGFSGYTPYLLMYINFLLNAGVFVYLVVQALHTDGRFNNYGVFFICLFSIAVLLLLKHALIALMSWLFRGIASDLQRYNFLILVFSCVMGFFLIPFNFVIAFAGTQNWQFFVTLWLLALASMFILYGAIRAFSLGTKYLFGYPMHFLLYLCTAEIVPVLLLMKLLR